MFSKEAAANNPFALLFDQLPFPTAVLRPDMVVEAVNQAFLERYGFKHGEVVGSPCYKVFYDRHDVCPKERCHFHDALAGQRNCFNLHQYVNEKGDEVFEEIHLVPLNDEDGQAQRIVEIVRDISEAKRLEASLTESNEFLQRLVNSMVGVVVAADMDGKILFANQSAKRVLGYEPAELVGQSLVSLAPREDLRNARRLLEKNKGQVQGIRTKVFTKDGGEVPVRLNSSYVYRDGEPVASVGIFTDLREKLKMEDHLVQARMQVVHSEKLARLGRMAAGIAHELNNPLTGITVYAELLKDSLPVDHPGQGDLNFIIEDAERCRDIVKGLLEYSRQGELRVEEVDLTEVVKEAFNLIRDNSVFLHVEVVRNYFPEPLMIQCDRKLLRQIFINLLMNAVDAMNGRGILTVTTYMDKEDYRCVEVSDTGSGIDKDHMRKVFDPFFTTKEVGKGTGLGLSVAFGVATRHGGEISVKETGPRGTTFLVRLPAQAPQELLAFARSYKPDQQG
jgi:two-component system NtrC family sensor kinase